jgi:hypothetical protein
MKISSTWLIAGSLLLAPLTLSAQPAPTPHPVATRSLCASTPESVRVAKPFKAGYEPGANQGVVAARRLGTAHAAVLIASPSEVRRDIVVELRNSCN